MKNLLARFWKEEEGMGTVEIVLIIAVLVAIALIFKNKITEWVTKATGTVFGNADAVISDAP